MNKRSRKRMIVGSMPEGHQHIHVTGPVASYVRVSTDEQRERATIETQRTMIATYYEQHGITQKYAYSDDGWSGRRFHFYQRPDGKRLLDDAKTHGFQTLIVYRIDRIARGRKLLSAIDSFESVGIRYITSVTEQTFDLKNHTDVLLLTMLSGVSGYEAESTLQRSSDATQRLAHEGQWLGGIVPYGYRVEGVKRSARLVPAEEPIPGRSDNLSEAGIIRLIFALIVEDGWTSQRIADHLNALGIPPAYARDGRDTIEREATALRGKRTLRVQGIWRSGRIVNMLHNTTYYGVHQYGKRSTSDQNKQPRPMVSRSVPALVDEVTWKRAQERLHEHQIITPKSKKYTYLLRGLISCGCCGLSYNGIAMNGRWLNTRQTEKMRAGDTTYTRGQPVIYYRCNGANQFRGIYGKQGQRCPSKAINGERLEADIWRDVEHYIRHPDEVIEQLAMQLNDRDQRADQLRDVVADLQMAAASKKEERHTILTLFRRGRIDEPTLDEHLDRIKIEEDEIQNTIVERQTALLALLNAEEGLRATSDLLKTLGAWLDNPTETPPVPMMKVDSVPTSSNQNGITPQQKRILIEALVERIVIETVTPSDAMPPEPQVQSNTAYRVWRRRHKTIAHVTYRFTPPQ